MIPMVDLKLQYKELEDEINTALLEALNSTQFILGPNVLAFEQEVADYLGVKHAIGVASGTDALHLSLIAAGIGPGDEVITTPFTFIATAEAISYVGAKPVFVDIEPGTFNIDLAQVTNAINDRTRAILPVHLYGQPVDMPALKSICDTNGLKLIEDCAQSFGAHINEKQTGSFGDAGAFSFFPSKNLGAFGDGGLITTQSDELADLVRVLRNHGSSRQNHHSVIGYNSRLDELQAVILRAKLKRIDIFNANRRRVSSLYKSMLANTGIQTPVENNIGHHVYHQYTCLHPERDKIIQTLRDADIACAIYYPVPLHQQEVFSQHCKDIELPNTESVAKRCFSLPVYPELTEDKIKIITDTIKKAL